MNYRLLVQLFIGLWLWPTAGMAGLEAGLAAYERGDYDTALREIRPLAEEGGRPCAVQTGYYVH